MNASFPSSADTRLHRRGEREHAARIERVLCFLGADPAFVEAVLGDLTEERAARTAVDGTRAAWRWYTCEAFRATPHLIASVVRGASGRRRAPLVMTLAITALAVTLTAWSVLSWRNAPAQLLAAGDIGGGIVVNNEKPVQLGMRVLGPSGRTLPDSGVRYRWLSGAPISVTPRGVVTCTQAGDAVVRASLGSLATQLILRCRPVHRLHTTWTIDLVLGDTAMPMSFLAVDAQGKTISLLRGDLVVEDSSVASLEVAADGTHRVRARAPGSTRLHIHIGDRGAGTGVRVYEPVSSPEGIRPGQHLATRVALAGGEVRQWHIPAGREIYEVAMLPYGDGKRIPALAIVGANCVTDGERSFRCITLQGASLFVYHPRQGDQTRTVRGTLVVSRDLRP